MELLFQLVRVDPEGSRHARRRLSFVDAVKLAGGGESAGRWSSHLAGEKVAVRSDRDHRRRCWVNLIHETLVRSKGWLRGSASGIGRPYDYIESARNGRRGASACGCWPERSMAEVSPTAVAGWSSLFGFRRLAHRGAPSSAISLEPRSRLVDAVAPPHMGVIGEGVWAMARGAPFRRSGRGPKCWA